MYAPVYDVHVIITKEWWKPLTLSISVHQCIILDSLVVCSSSSGIMHTYGYMYVCASACVCMGIRGGE